MKLATALTEADEPIVLSILLPVRNEGINLRTMLKMLAGMVEVSHEVLVIHDDRRTVRVLLDDNALKLTDFIAGIIQRRGPCILIYPYWFSAGDCQAHSTPLETPGRVCLFGRQHMSGSPVS